MKRPCYINCYLCFKEFKVKPHRQNTAKFCNKQCMNIYIKEFGFEKKRLDKMSKIGKEISTNKNWIKKVSQTWFKKNHIPWNKNKSVRLSLKSEFKKGEKHPYFGKKGKEIPNFTGKNQINTHNYILIYKPNHREAMLNGYVLEHRYKISNKLNRKLKFNEIIHHIDGNRSNNELNNLLVLTQSQHAKLHAFAYLYLIKQNLIQKYIKWFFKNV